MEEANAQDEEVTIALPAATYALTSDTQIDATNTDHAISIEGDGADTTVIDGNETTRIFGIATGADLTLEGVTLANASTTTHGGAVNNQGTLTVTNSAFSQNTADGGANGGAINNDGSASISNTSFTGNSAPSSGTADGGAIYNNDAELSITDSLFESNMAGGDAGAIENDSDLTVTGTVFRSNEAAAADGGAIDNDGAATTSITDSVFEDNAATLDDGGAIDHSAEGDLTISSTEFRSNTAGEEGGAIVSDDGPVTVTDSTFAENTAADNGGAIHTEIGGTTHVEDSTFERNQSGPDVGDSGGAIYNAGGEGVAVLTVSNSTFRGNVAPADDSYGGAIENDFGQADIRSSTLVGNDAHEGGGLSSRGGFVTATNTTISGNTADEGAGVYAGAVASMDLEHVTIARNTARVQGGGIHNPDSEINVGHTLIAENDPQNCSGTGVGSDGHNVTDDESCELLFDGESGDRTDVADAHITDLGNYGGDTQVHALLSESPAIDVAESGETDETCEDAEGVELNEDQRGAERPVDGDDTGLAFCDAGAFEYHRPDSLTLAPADATNETDTEHTVTATVTDTLDAPSESITVRFAVSGANSDSGAAVTDANGEASFTYTGSNAGDDTIEAYADTDGDGTQDEGEPSDTAAKTWQEPPEEPSGETVRLGGETRWETAIEISGDRFADGSADTVVLARGDDPDGYADALAGAPLAVCQDAPLLITTPDELLPEVADEIERVLGESGTVILLGLTDALDESVEASVEGLGYTTERIGGAERIETSIDIAERIESECYTPANVMIARAFEFADALTGGAAASSTDGVIVLNQDDSRNDRVETYIGDRGDAALYALGGQIADLYPEAEGLFGTGRVETSVEVANEFFSGPTTVGVARAGEFPDSLTGGAHIGAIGGPMLLTQDAAESERLGRPLDPAAGDYLCTNSDTIATASIYGGVVAISADTEAAIDDRISGQGC